MKKALLLSLTALFAGSTVTIQTKAMEVKEVIAPADEELEIVPFETKQAENPILKSAKEYAFPITAAGIAVAIFYMRAFKPEAEKLVDPSLARIYFNKLSAKVNDFYALSCKYKDPIADASSAFLLLCVGKAAFAGNLTDMFNNGSKNLPFGTGTFMKAKEPKEAK